MPSSWADMVDTYHRHPTPQERLDALADFYRTQPSKNILLEALGAHNRLLPGMPAIAAPLVKHMITICVDTESSTNNTDLLTEVGLNQLKRSDSRAVARNPGPHGVRIMELLRFLHFRVVEHAHLLSNRETSLGPLGNRFGQTSFCTFEELRVILRHLFNQPIQSDDPALEGCMRPIVLIGHALRHDEENGKKQGLNYDFAANKTIVAKVDTQPLARELGIWVPHPTMRTNQIGLRVLIEDRAMFLHLDDHTACNDAARTMMCAIWMVLPACLKENQTRTMQEIANHIEARSKVTSPNPYGSLECCTRCSHRNHSTDECKLSVSCAACAKFDTGPDRIKNIKSHIETYCPHVARFKAWARRYRDAFIKNRATGRPFSGEILAGPGPDAHPWSTWRGLSDVMWPLEDLSDVLVGMSMMKEPTAFVYNMQSALGGLPVPSTGTWVLIAPHGPTNGISNRMPSSAAPTVNGTHSTTSFPSLPLAIDDNTSAPIAHHVVTMSEQRGHGRCGSVRGSAHVNSGYIEPPRRRGGKGVEATASVQTAWEWPC